METKNNTFKSVQLQATYRGLSKDDPTIQEWVISNEQEDRHGTVFKISGWELDSYSKNPVVLYQHESRSSNPDMVIGKSTLRVEDGELIASLTYEPEEINPTANKIAQKVEFGSLRSASVGVLPLEGRWGDKTLGENPDILYFTRQELTEWSIVTVPSNTSAVKRDFSEIVETFKESKSTSEPTNQPSNQRGISLFEAQLTINKNKAL